MSTKFVRQSLPKDIQELRITAQEALTYLDTKLATDAQISLEDMLNSSGLGKAIFGELEITLAKIKFVRFLSLSEQEALELITNYFPLAFSVENLDVKDRIGKRISFAGEIEDQMTLMQQMLKAIEEGKYYLGQKQIEFEGKSYEPSLGNWVKVYLQQPSKNPLRTNIDEWTFAKQGLGSKFLGKAESDILLEILKIYDSLKNRISQYYALPESDDENEIFKDFDLYADIPGLAKNKTEREEAFAQGVVSPEEELPQENRNPNLPKYSNTQKFVLPKEVLEPKTNTPVEPQAKKIDLDHVLNEGKGISFSGAKQAQNQQAEKDSSKPLISEIKPIEAVKKTEASITDNEKRAKELLEKIQLVKKAPEVPKKPVVSNQQAVYQAPLQQTQDLDQIRAEIQKKKAIAQDQIDKKIKDLKEKLKNEPPTS